MTSRRTNRDPTVRLLSALLGCGIAAAIVVVAWMAWFFGADPAQERAERRRRGDVEAALAIDRSERVREVVRDHGFQILISGDQPLVPFPSDVDAHGKDWWGTRAHGGLLEPPLRGAIVVAHQDNASLAEAHHALPDHLRADSSDALGWVAILRRRVHDSPAARPTDDVHVEQVDVRLVSLEDGTLFARGTHRAVATPGSQGSRVYYGVSDESVARLVANAVRSAQEAAPFDPDPSLETACPVDAAEAPRNLDRRADPSCRDQPLSVPACRAHCLRGHPVSCLRIAFAHWDQREEGAPAPIERPDRPYLLRACLYGESRGCTHWAAGATSADDALDPDAHSDPALECVARIMVQACKNEDDDERACAHWERMRFYGMGMSANPEAASAELRKQCAKVNGLACAFLGELQARGAFGREQRVEAAANYARACESGWAHFACDVDIEDWPLDLLESHGGGG